MIRLLVLLALVVVLWMVASWLLEAARKALEPTADRRPGGEGSGTRDRPERLVACTQCGSYVPSSRAIIDLSSRSYCSDRCHRAHDTTDSPGGPSGPHPEPPA